jgi:aminoglycoside phosphotransferase family enzyme/predicted kinase
MDTSFADVVAAMSAPECHGSETAPVVIHTHASVVFLVGDCAYKLKKPVDFGFLDYSTLGRREQMCRAEVELNRRLAPDVYLGVVPVARASGHIVVDGPGEIVEWAVKMRRLPDDASWSAMLERGVLSAAHVRSVGRVLGAFHRDARRDQAIAAWGAFEHVARLCRDNLDALAAFDGLDPGVVDRLLIATERELTMRRPLVQTRMRAGVPCELHGDLRLEHVYDLGGRGAPADIRVVDCIEFSELLRHGDPASDIAFLAMDLRMHGAWRLADVLVDAWVEVTGDEEARELLPLFASYRSAVRAKVRALQARDPMERAEHRDELQTLARGHVLLALGELAAPQLRPCLVLVAGLPGTGKSRLSEDLARVANMHWIRADSVRKELAHVATNAPARAGIEDGLYTHEWNDRTYHECLLRAADVLAAGGRAVVDASFKEEHRRRDFIALARRLGVRVLILCCEAPADVVRERLAARTGDPSDADWTVYEHAVRTWDAWSEPTREHVAVVDTSRAPSDAVDVALARMRALGLAEPSRAQESTKPQGGATERSLPRAP